MSSLFLAFHPYEVGDLMLDLRLKGKALACSLTGRCTGQKRIQLSFSTSRRITPYLTLLFSFLLFFKFQYDAQGVCDKGDQYNNTKKQNTCKEA